MKMVVRSFIKYFLMCFMCLNIAQCQTRNQVQDLKLECLSPLENEYIQDLYSVFEKKLIDRYGKRKRHKLLSNYVKDFSKQKIHYLSFFKSFQVDTTSEEFHRMFIKNSQLPQENNILNGNISEEIVVIRTDKKEKVSEPERDSPLLVASALDLSFKKNEYEDKLLQIYIMYHLFVLPNLHLQSR